MTVQPKLNRNAGITTGIYRFIPTYDTYHFKPVAIFFIEILEGWLGLLQILETWGWAVNPDTFGQYLLLDLAVKLVHAEEPQNSDRYWLWVEFKV